jgi:hypothetical protein
MASTNRRASSGRPLETAPIPPDPMLAELKMVGMKKMMRKRPATTIPHKTKTARIPANRLFK